MPKQVSVAYSGNTVRVTFRTFTWDDLQASADSIKVSVYKVEDKQLVAIPPVQNHPVDGTKFKETAAGEYRFFLDTQTLSAGQYHIIFEGEIGGSGFYEPVPLTLKTLKSEVSGR